MIDKIEYFWGNAKRKDINSNATIRCGEKRLAKLMLRDDITTNKRIKKQIKDITKRINNHKEFIKKLQ